ncbi:MAG: efflux RND transporter periplasmic adaptor subunit [Alphaproteobacteria bacterium]|nr:efflux RND transporter periplasmic adaptor subunit [Alphaproteobacteria bacterium]NNF25064.1 efflux RND transporter periplasmic adaptor subunit [Paracoccaceae bacterium]
MRYFSILTAIVVVGVLYFLVFERDELLDFADAGDNAPIAEASSEDAEETIEDTAPVVAVVAMRSEAKTIDSAVIVRGRTEAARQVDVRAEISGLVVSEPLRKGSRVEAGQLLCKLDTGTRDIALTETTARLAEAQARLTDARINENAASRLNEDGFAAETRVTAAQAAAQSALAGVQSAEAAVAGAEKELERLEIRAPFGGLLESDSAEIGSLLQPGALCATIIQLNPIKMVGFVPETEVERAEVGAPAGARLASGREVIGEVTFLSRSADPATRTFRVEVEVDNSDLSIRDGQTAEIAIASDGATAHLLPQSSLTLNSEGNLGVRLVDDASVAAFAPISVLRDTSEGIWVAGLDQQVSVIVVGQEFVTDGVPVKPTFRETTQ